MLGGVENTSVSPVFVGRADELTILNDALARAAAGEPQALLLGGEAGVGKTRLVEEFIAGACRRDAVVALGGCVEIGADGLPYAPFSTALRALRRRLPDEMAAAATGQEDELARLLPELGETSSNSRTEDGTARLFELTVRLLERTAADRTVVLVLEDMHWADASTRHLLSYIFRTLRRGRIVVVATYRADDIHRRHPLRPLLAELDRLRTVRRIELDRFTRSEVHRQLTGILAAEPDARLVDDIFTRSDGNAFFVEELAVCSENGCVTGISDSLRDLLLVRVETLPENAQRVARFVAEGGSTVEYPLLAAVARLSEDDLIEALRAAVGANILLATPDGDGYRFRHSLVREAVSDDLLPGERSRLNRRCAEALEADPSLVRADERTTRLAGYWYYAHDAAKALPAVLNASVEARRRHAYSEQLRLLERAMEVWDSAPDEVRRELRPLDYADAYPACDCAPDSTAVLRYLDLMAEATVAARLCGERERALKICKKALRMIEDEQDPPPSSPLRSSTGDPLRAAWFWIQRSRLMQNLGRGDGWAEISRAQELVRGLSPSAVHAQVLASSANWGWLHEPGPDSLAAAERAVEYARLVDAEEIELSARLTLGGLLADSGDIERGLTIMRDTLKRIGELGLIAELGRAHTNLASNLESVGRSSEAIEVAAAGVELARTYSLGDNEAWARRNMAESLFSLGRWDELGGCAQRVLDAAHSTAPRGGVALLLAALALARGELDAATAHLASAHEHFGTHDPMPQHSIPVSQIVLGIAAGQGRLDDARAELARTVEAGFAPGTQRFAWPLLFAAATAEANTRGLPSAEAGRAATLTHIRTTARKLAAPAPVWAAYSLLVASEADRAEGIDRAERWAEVVTALEQVERPYELARARHHWAAALLAEGGDRGAAGELIRLVHAVAGQLGARPLREEAELLAQRARISLTSPGPVAASAPDDGFGLTSREQDVLRLVAVGRSNRQIAEELFISPKTASVHVSNILAKLGVTGRGEAAALAHRLRLFPDEQAPAQDAQAEVTRAVG
ncbi:helix-turn-helix transcriptional regulator [Streptomyces beijiangensis]|uniref:AAA family ATPase n=1 Tax=Streptomyces beijiangensis TaxID=163361 RepID=A0A939FDN3_9ACTN|nr:helix-turn-helix transcriptional regulator [Streptomyces beijiangensis]MBO0516281.1 AAA family ATPase [Streptomyces beijiangensis]